MTDLRLRLSLVPQSKCLRPAPTLLLASLLLFNFCGSKSRHINRNRSLNEDTHSLKSLIHWKHTACRYCSNLLAMWMHIQEFLLRKSYLAEVSSLVTNITIFTFINNLHIWERGRVLVSPTNVTQNKICCIFFLLQKVFSNFITFHFFEHQYWF